MADWIGKTLGKVRIESLIARGGMAEVYLGTHGTLGRQVAVKVMRTQLDKDSDNLARFQREAQVVAGLRHPNIIQMLDHDIVNEQPYLVMEYIPGPTLATYLRELQKRNEKLPLETTSRIIASLAQALDYAHSQGLVHRDVKPANVLLRSQSSTINLNEHLPVDVEPILTDFGLVRHTESSMHTATGTVAGTPTYMSPEQARGDKVDKRTDIYALGVMFYEMLAGNVPFESDSTFGVLLKHINEPPAPIEGISTDLQAVVDRAMAKNPEFRYERASEMADDFRAIFNGATIAPKTMTMAKMARDALIKQEAKPTRLSAWMWTAIGLAVVAVFAAGFFFRTPADSPSTPIPSEVTNTSPIGTIKYNDFNANMDKATITLNIDPPPPGSHYEVWYISDDGKTKRNAGKVDFSGGLDHGELDFIELDQQNIIGMFNQIEVTLESDNDPAPDQPGEIVYSSIFPPKALIHTRHVLSMFDPAPDQIALIQGLWVSADSIRTTAQDLQSAFEAKDKKLTLKKTEELINQIVGSQNTAQYIDWDQDGTIDDPGDKFGLLDNGGIAYDTGKKVSQGYIPQTTSHAEFAAQAPDATENIINESKLVVICINNMKSWSEQLVEKSVQLAGTPFGKDMEPLITDINKLASNLVAGVDSNGNQLIEPTAGECGADTAYEHAYGMADMPIIPGVGQLPKPANAP